MASSRKAASIVKHTLKIAGHSTSVSLEDAFWSRLRRVADQHKRPLAALVAEIDANRGDANLSSAIRVFLLEAVAASTIGRFSNESGDPSVGQYGPAADGSLGALGGASKCSGDG